ncbi:autotransporter assembly complex protein TamA [Yoonia sp. 208BN28-4]|uniref:autotransporter assembly complex protein TamA n=1 Tax=Yoonia sp. 208BN28-4 TaxID=3126505 RepID=UPI0030B4E9EE
MKNLTIAAALAAILTCPVTATAQEVTFSAPNADEDLTDLLRSASLTLEIDPEEGSAAQDYVAAARADYRRILTALYADGYYGGTISIKIDGREAASLAPLDAPSRVNRITIDVATGPRFTFGRTDIAPLAPATTLPEGFRSGEPAQSEVIRSSVSAATSAWRDAGYAKVSPSGQQITARHPAERLDVSVSLATGPRLTFGPLTVSGNEDVRTNRILRIAGLPTGEIYSPDAIARAEDRLRRTGAFASVALVESDDIGPNNTLPVTAQIVEAKPRRIGAGIELSTVDGLTLSSFWLHRNFLGGAERFRVEGEISGIGGETGGTDYRLSASLRRPAVWGADTDFLNTISISRQDEPNYLLDQFSLESTLTRPVGDNLTIEGGLGILAAREVTDTGERDYVLLTVPLSATYDLRDNATNPKNGYYLDLDATPFISIVGGDNGARAYADGRIYRSFGEDDRFTLAARSQIGTVLGASLDTAPADFLYFSGGSNTVRGQRFQSLGVDRVIDGEDVRTGGLSFVGAQLEGRVDVTESIGLVGFYDTGFVGDTSNPFGDGEWQSGAGFGVRYNTGIGPIRLDIATPASGDNAYDRVEVYIGIGQAF